MTMQETFSHKGQMKRLLYTSVQDLGAGPLSWPTPGDPRGHPEEMGMGVPHHRLSLTFSGVCVPEQKSPGQVFVAETQEMFLMVVMEVAVYGAVRRYIKLGV